MMYGVLSARLARTPALIGEEASDAIGRRWTGHQFFRWLSMRADAIVAVSPSARDYLVQQLGIPAQKVRLINNGVVERPPAGAESLLKIRERFGLTADHLVTGCVGRLVDEHKKVSDLIRALPELVAADDRVRLLIVGDGPDRAALEALAETTGVAQFVIFAGYQSRPQDFYPLMDIFAHVAAREAFGLVIAEAMFAGLPVLATRVGGIPNVVKEDETALLVAPGDISEIARQLRRLLSDAGLRKRLAGAGHARAAALFSSERYVAETERLYMDVLAQRGRTAAGRSPAG
jgi:glycosyltransferase involved in cell wall biosynthesis